MYFVCCNPQNDMGLSGRWLPLVSPAAPGHPPYGRGPQLYEQRAWGRLDNAFGHLDHRIRGHEPGHNKGTVTWRTLQIGRFKRPRGFQIQSPYGQREKPRLE